MWDKSVVDPGHELRQGDLLCDIAVPKVPKLPLNVARASSSQFPTSGDLALVNVAVGHYLVTSQCCVIEQDDVVYLAPVKLLKNVTDDQQADYFAPMDAARVVIRAHALDPVPGHLQVDGSQLYFADLTAQTPVARQKELLGAFAARMTPQGRAVLRDRLALFWSRAEPEDAELLGL